MSRNSPQLACALNSSILWAQAWDGVLCTCSTVAWTWRSMDGAYNANKKSASDRSSSVKKTQTSASQRALFVAIHNTCWRNPVRASKASANVTLQRQLWPLSKSYLRSPGMAPYWFSRLAARPSRRFWDSVNLLSTAVLIYWADVTLTVQPLPREDCTKFPRFLQGFGRLTTALQRDTFFWPVHLESCCSCGKSCLKGSNPKAKAHFMGRPANFFLLPRILEIKNCWFQNLIEAIVWQCMVIQ